MTTINNDCESLGTVGAKGHSSEAGKCVTGPLQPTASLLTTDLYQIYAVLSINIIVTNTVLLNCLFSIENPVSKIRPYRGKRQSNDILRLMFGMQIGNGRIQAGAQPRTGQPAQWLLRPRLGGPVPAPWSCASPS